MSNIASVIDQHRVASMAFGTTREGRSGRWATCECGHESASYYDEQTGPIDAENNPERDTQRKHAAHVSQMLQDAQRAQEPTTERVSPLGAPGVTFRAVERSTATKYQIQAFERDDYPEKMAADLLRRAANEIGKGSGIPTQIKIDQSTSKRGQVVTVTWFA